MIRLLRASFPLLICAWGMTQANGQVQPEWEIEALNDQGWVEYDYQTGVATATNGVLVKYGGAVLTAERVAVREETGEVVADGRVRIQQGDQLWASEHLLYNFKTRQMKAAQFRTGKDPVFAYGEGLHGEVSNRVYYATNAFLTADDVDRPLLKVRAKYIKITPGDRIEARHATVLIGKVPVFYFPSFSRKLKGESNNFDFVPGYRNLYGAYLLSTYNWFLNDQFDGAAHVDYRVKRGIGVGPDVNYHLGPYGEGSVRYYYLHDLDPNADNTDVIIPKDRQRVYFTYDATPATNLNFKSVVRYQTDPYVVHDFFETEYRQNPQPNTFFEANKFWQNFSLDTYVQPRVNDFLETVERLPDVRLTGYRQQLWETPLYYESESSAGYYQRLFAENAGTNGAPPGLNYAASRADTFHQILLPYTFFGWLDVAPRAGGRFTYYSKASGPGATTEEAYRGVFNTGMEVSFKASRVWPDIQNQFFQVDGLRHIMVPSVNYVFVPEPNYVPGQLPQFDYQIASLMQLPVEFADYNSIDAIDTQNVMRLGLRNKIQTKREAGVVNFLDWNLSTDWRLTQQASQTTFNDLYSDLILKPFSWLTLESLTRYDIPDRDMRMTLYAMTLQPNDVWSVGMAYWYLRDDPVPMPQGLGPGNDILNGRVFFRANENWAFRASFYYNINLSKMQEQYYTIYRDLRSWTAALTFRVRENSDQQTDYTVAFTFSLKAFPRLGLGKDTVQPYSLLGN
jgi:LPS-assembly protein